MAFDFDALWQLVEGHTRVARLVIVEAKGSTPRDIGTSMYVWDGGQSGTIGGGALEYSAVRQARNQLKGPRDQLTNYPLGPALGQCCGGAVKIWCEIYDANRMAALTHGPVIRRFAGRKPPSPRWAKRLSAIERGAEILDQTLVQEGWIIEPYVTHGKPIWIWGAGHVGRAIVDVIAPLPDNHITWVDIDRTRFPEHIKPNVSVLTAKNPAQLMEYAPQNARHLILTHCHALDLDLCHQALLCKAAWIGLIGSATKATRFRKRLQELGHAHSTIARINCPIGERSWGKHPQQIAIGVAAKILDTTAKMHTLPKEHKASA